MRVEMKTSGFDELQQKLRALPDALSTRVQVAALKAGAEPIRDTAAALAPRDEEGGPPHLADNIVIATVPKREMEANGLFDQVGVAVGPTVKVFWGLFQEIGTAFHAAQPFMRPAFDSNVRKSQRIVAIEAWNAIRRALHGGPSAPSGGRTL